MAKHRVAVTGFVAALALAAAPCAAQAGPAKAITKDTILKIGTKGVLNLDGWDPKSEKFKSRRADVAVRVTKIEKGKVSDLKGLGLPKSATGMVPYYIRSELSYVGADFQGSVPLFDGEFSDGSRAAAILTSRDVGPCAITHTIELSKKQKTSYVCTAVLAPPKVPVVSASVFHPIPKKPAIYVRWTKTGK